MPASAVAVNRRTIAQTFAARRAAGRIALMPFITAGYPDLATTVACLEAIDGAGADLIEVGIPFSDPIADGPTIQASYTAALAKGLKVRDVFDAIHVVRPRVAAPMLAMVSYSIVFRSGAEAFARQAKQAGFDGLIIPDLPPPEADRVCGIVHAAGLETVLLVAPTTTPQRRAEIARLSSGFVYYLSVMGITGERDALPADLKANVTALRNATDKPVCVGFGISTPQHVRQLQGVADGAIVGSAFVKRMTQHTAEGPNGVAAAVGTFCRELLSGVG